MASVLSQHQFAASTPVWGRLAQDSFEHPYSPMMLTSTRLRRRPSRLTGQPFRLALEDPLSGAKVETAVGHRHHHLAPPHAQHCELRSVSGVRRQPVLMSGTGVLTSAVVQPASAPAASLMKVRGVIFRAFTRVSPLFIIYHSQASDGRDLGGNRPRSEQTLPLKAIWLYAFSALCYSPDCSYSILIYAPSAWCEPRPPAPAGKTRLNHHPPLGTTRWIKAQGWASAPHWVGQRVRAICTPPGDRRVAFPTSCRAQSQLPPNR